MADHTRPTRKAIHAYYDALKSYTAQHVEHEGALETAFSRLLADTARPLIPKMSLKVGSKNIAPDGTLRDEFYLRHGYWEARDTHDDLNAEIRAKIRKGYPLSNTIFEDNSAQPPRSVRKCFSRRVFGFDKGLPQGDEPSCHCF